MAINIEIGQDHLITSDKLNIIVNRKVLKMDKPGKEGKPTGEFTWKENSFHPTFERALEKILQDKLKASESQDLKQALSVIEEYKSEIKNLVSVLKIEYGKEVAE